jgi:putative glutamine amidotransferase
MFSVGQTYVRAVAEAGGLPVVLPPTLTTEDWPQLVERLDGLLLTGGEDVAPCRYGQEPEAWLGGVDEERDASELGLVRATLEGGLPVLAICRGHQLLNVALRGTLYQDISAHFPEALDHAYVPGRPMEEIAHSVTLAPKSLLAHILGGEEFPVNSAHHQSVKRVGEGLRIVARAPDGIVEGVESLDHPFCVGVQWHPEAMVKVDEAMRPLFAALVEAGRG